MSDTRSCLVEKLGYYIEIDDIAGRQLAALEEHEQSFDRHEAVYHSEDALQFLYVVKSGWLHSYTDLPDGRRQITQIFHPGDIIGFPDIAFEVATTNVRASETALLCPFPKTKLDKIFRDSPKLTALFFSLANRDHACLIDTLRALGRMRAQERLAYFLLDLVCRLRITNSGMTDTMRLPLNQHEIGDALGLTHTYVSKTLREMETDGLISRQGVFVTLLEEETLREMVDFTDRYETLDTLWFPQ